MPTPEKALNAALEPKYIRPSRISMVMSRSMAFRGMSRRRWMTLHHLDPGMAPSRANAQVQRLVVVTHPMPQMRPRTINGRRQQKAPMEFPVADITIGGTGWPEAMSLLSSGRTKQRGISRARPAKRLIATVRTMALGTWMAGSRTSSHILPGVNVGLAHCGGHERDKGTEGDPYEMIMPVADVAQDPCRRPTQNDHPAGHPA